MDSFFSKASSFVSSQVKHEAPHPPSHLEPAVSPSPSDNIEEPRKPAGSAGGYGDLLAGAQALMGSAKKPSSDGGHASEGEPHKSPSSGGYGDILASAQSFMGAGKSSSGGGGTVVDKDEGKEDATHKSASSGGAGYADVLASAQVMMGAAKISMQEGGSADMGEVAGAASNIIGAASKYGNLEKTSYGEYTKKAQTYLNDYKDSHSKTGTQGMKKPASSPEERDEEDYNPSNKPPTADEESFDPRSRTPVKPKEEMNEEDYNPTPVKPRVNYRDQAEQDE